MKNLEPPVFFDHDVLRLGQAVQFPRHPVLVDRHHPRRAVDPHDRIADLLDCPPNHDASNGGVPLEIVDRIVEAAIEREVATHLLAAISMPARARVPPPALLASARCSVSTILLRELGGASLAAPRASRGRPGLGPVAERLVGVSPTLLLVAIAGLWFLPIVGAITTSLRPGYTQSSAWWTDLLNPSTWTLGAYRVALSNSANNTFPEAMFNTFAIAVPATLIPVLVASWAAYALVWIPFKGHGVLLGSIVALIAVPIYAILIPLLQAYSTGAHLTLPIIDKTVTLFPDVGLAGTLPAVWLTHIGAALPFSVFLLTYAMARLPRSLVDNAHVDGASHIQIYWHVILPLSAPALAALGVLLFVWSWNDFVIALTMIGGGNPSALPVTVRFGSFSAAVGGPVVLAALMIHSLVSIAVFLGLQRYFVRGLLAGIE